MNGDWSEVEEQFIIEEEEEDDTKRFQYEFIEPSIFVLNQSSPCPYRLSPNNPPPNRRSPVSPSKKEGRKGPRFKHGHQ